MMCTGLPGAYTAAMLVQNNCHTVTTDSSHTSEPKLCVLESWIGCLSTAGGLIGPPLLNS